MKKVGILGGGQLGRMLLQAAANYPVITYVLENDYNAPAAHLCHYFEIGDIQDFNTVYNFGKKVDVITIEIENVNIEALQKLEDEGVLVIPKTAVLKTIKNKILQKEFYSKNSIPTANFVITNNKTELQNHLSFLPAVHKIAEGGYDGKGVAILENENDLIKAFDAPSILEKKIKLNKEIAIIIAIAQDGSIAVYPPVEMVCDAVLNLLDYQLCPANLPQNIFWKAEAIALAVAKNFNSAGLFAVELLIDVDGEVFVNETAPRVHNSGHHTIEAHYSSQFDMLWRILLNYPLGNTKALMPSTMVNIIGSENNTGTAFYQGMEEILKIENCFLHIYGKEQTKPGRKMGHITVMSNDIQEILYQAHKIKNLLKVIVK